MRQYLGHFYGQFSMSGLSAVISNCSTEDTLSNTADSEKTNNSAEKTNNLIDDPDLDETHHCLRKYFH